MDFLAILLVYASDSWVSSEIAHEKHEAYCQNLYWQPNAREKLEQFGCDIYDVEVEITRVQSGRY